MKLFGKYELRKIDNCPCEVRGSNLSWGELFGRQHELNIAAVFRCINLISDSIAQLPISVKVLDEEHYDTAPGHPLNIVFNGRDGIPVGRFHFMKMLVMSALMRGAGYAYVTRNGDGSVKSLRYLENSDVTLHYDKMKPQEMYYQCNLISRKKIEPVNMLSIIYHSYNGVEGNSILRYARKLIETALAAEGSANEYFSSGMALKGIITAKNVTSQNQLEQIRQAWNTTYTGGGSGLAILPNSIEYQSVSQNASESELLETRKYNAQAICMFFGINPALLGIEGSNLTIEEAQIDFLTHCLAPWIALIEEEFTRKLLKPSETNLRVNLDETVILKSNKNASADYYSKLLEHGILCVNEVRQELGYNSVEGGDQHFVAYTDITQNILGQTPQEDEDNTTKKILSE